MIRKSQYLSIENNHLFKLYYFDKDSPYSINYKNDGSLDKNFGEGFLDVSDDIALDIFMENNKDI